MPKDLCDNEEILNKLEIKLNDRFVEKTKSQVDL